MIDQDNPFVDENQGASENEFSQEVAQLSMESDVDDNPIQKMLAVEVISTFRAWFSIQIVSPEVKKRAKPIIHMPDSLQDRPDMAEHVYPIIERGDTYSISKASEMLQVGMSMCRLHYTIEKIIWLINERLPEEDGSGGGLMDPSREILLAIDGHPWAMRYAFASIINLPGNVILSNYDPGDWGEKYLQMLNRLGEQGYGYPPQSPRDVFQKVPGQPSLKR